MFKKLAIILFFSVLTNAQKDIFELARTGSLEEAKEYIGKNPKSVNQLNENGFSPLILACYRSNNEVAKYLIEKGADINGNSKMGTPLMAAIVKGNNEIAKTLISKKANLNLADENGTTALIYAVQFKNIELIKLLLEKKADKNLADKSGKTPFEHATFSKDESIISILKN